MRFLRWAALIVAITAGYLATPGGRASAAALPTAGLAATAGSSLVSEVQWRRHRGYRRGFYRPRRVYYRPVYYRRAYYRPRFYRPRVYRPFYARPRIVCRVRYGYYGPRRACFRRY